jgi:hypothetical protein
VTVRARGTLVPIAVAAACAIGAGFAHRESSRRRDALPDSDDLVYLPRPTALRASSLGHTELAADLVFIRAVIYFASQFVGTRNYDWLDDHIDAANFLDPDFRAPYLFASRATMYNGLPITNRSVQSSNHFLEAGLRRFPGDWELSFALGCNYLFELQTDDPAQKEAWRRTGGRWIRHAAIAGGGPAWLAGLAAKIMSEEGEVEASIRYLEEAYLTAQDDKARDEIQRLLAIKRAGDVQRLAAARDAFTAGWQRTLPYGPPDLYVLIGDPPSPRLDLPFLTADPVLEADARAAAEADERDRQ